ncbi:MAG TPA: hypothetical protein VH138_04120 [Vicinamibacterales bacterium]|nr:hypothetical protein [Vicinamibacterales bacterium]
MVGFGVRAGAAAGAGQGMPFARMYSSIPLMGEREFSRNPRQSSVCVARMRFTSPSTNAWQMPSMWARIAAVSASRPASAASAGWAAAGCAARASSVSRAAIGSMRRMGRAP